MISLPCPKESTFWYGSLRFLASWRSHVQSIGSVENHGLEKDINLLDKFLYLCADGMGCSWEETRLGIVIFWLIKFSQKQLFPKQVGQVAYVTFLVWGCHMLIKPPRCLLSCSRSFFHLFQDPECSKNSFKRESGASGFFNTIYFMVHFKFHFHNNSSR